MIDQKMIRLSLLIQKGFLDFIIRITPEEENMQKVTEKVQGWITDVAKEKGWDEVKFSGGQCILENKFTN